MADKWYFAHDGMTYGPYSAGQLQEQAAAGRVRPQDTVWKEGLDKRAPASKVQHLFAAAPVAPPALVAPAGPATPVADFGDYPDDPGLVPLEDGPVPPPASVAPATPPKAGGAKGEAGAPRRPTPEPRKKRVLSTKGAVLSSQDGVMMKFRKQCVKCNHLDNSMTTMPIPNGGARMNFYCTKCKKSRQVEIQGVG
jgi:hypothetical protein